MRTYKCKICDSQDLEFISSVKDSNHYLDGEWNLYHCKTCDVHFLPDAPDSAEIKKYYPENRYYTHNRIPSDGRLITTVYDHFYGRKDTYTAHLAYLLLHKNVNMFPPKNTSGDSTLLDVGCGNGQLLSRFSRYGFRCEGYDVDANALRVAKESGMKTHSGEFYELQFNEKYTVVIMNQVLEHLHDPIKMLARLKELLTPGGCLIISVPNSDSIDFRILRDSWTAFQAPTHIFHYNKKSLDYLLGVAGFRVYDVAFSSSLGTLKKFYIKKNISNLFKIEESNLVAAAKSILFLFSQMMVFVPFVSRLKRNRITVYCELQ